MKITKPTLLIDRARCERNIETMMAKARRNQVALRPHFKTHQSLEIGSWFKKAGVDRITVSSFDMAMYFSKEWEDITIAFPVNILEIETINFLAKKITLSLLIESTDTIKYLSNHLKYPVEYFIKIDVGTHRTGISPSRIDVVDDILRIAESNGSINFKGFLCHAGHTYSTKKIAEVSAIHEQSISYLTQLKERYISRYPNLLITVGDTPSCSLLENFEHVDEMRPGNFVFYDLTQNQIGSCVEDQIGAAVACPIVAIHPERNEIVIYGGGVHFSKEYLDSDLYGKIYGVAVESNGKGWTNQIPDTYLKSLSQEHGIVSVPAGDISKYKVGDIMKFLPVHSCMTMNLMRNFQVV